MKSFKTYYEHRLAFEKQTKAQSSGDRSRGGGGNFTFGTPENNKDCKCSCFPCKVMKNCKKCNCKNCSCKGCDCGNKYKNSDKYKKIDKSNKK